jgi:two-component system osmolarity sensor histidine kinase EnvZ
VKRLLQSRRLAWVRSGLFWRTFFLLGVLTMVSLATWVGITSVVQRGPQAEQAATHFVSIVTITQAALTYSAPELRRELLVELVSNEGIRVRSLEEADQVEPPLDTALMKDIQKIVRERLGSDTQFASSVNGMSGFWISFKIDGDKYWLMLERERVSGLTGVQWLGWAALVGLLSIIGAGLISSLVNRPLERLTEAARAIAHGKRPAPLPEKGTGEITEANRSFNQMVEDLQQVETDRAVILAGISHDLRTPLARMGLEVEMAQLSSEAREGMQSDIAQMDAIIGQFLDYAKPTEAATFVPVDISALLEEAARNAERNPALRITTQIEPGLVVLGNDTDLRRVINNLIENARRYGATPGEAYTEIDISCHQQGMMHLRRIIIEVQDHGTGVPAAQIEQLIKPFTRMDTARGQANGAGLGLAIVDRVIARHNAELQVGNREGGGLQVRIVMPSAS